MPDKPSPDLNPADPDEDDIITDAVRRRMSEAYAQDPMKILPAAAMRRIDDAREKAALIRTRAAVEVETRHHNDPKQAAIVLAEASLAEAREVLHVMMNELRTAGKSELELAKIMQDEIDGLELSLELTGTQRYLLRQELRLYRYTEPQDAPLPTAVKPRQPGRARSRGETLIALEGELRKMKAEGLTQREMCDRLDCNKQPRPFCKWNQLTYSKAYRSKEHGGSVKKWLSLHSKPLPAVVTS